MSLWHMDWAGHWRFLYVILISTKTLKNIMHVWRYSTCCVGWVYIFSWMIHYTKFVWSSTSISLFMYSVRRWRETLKTYKIDRPQKRLLKIFESSENKAMKSSTDFNRLSWEIIVVDHLYHFHWWPPFSESMHRNWELLLLQLIGMW